MNWLREHMRDQLINAAPADARQNVASFRGDPAAGLRHGTSSALDLVSEAAEVIRDIQERAAEFGSPRQGYGGKCPRKAAGGGVPH